jgi:hypothetical protein
MGYSATGVISDCDDVGVVAKIDLEILHRSGGARQH